MKLIKCSDYVIELTREFCPTSVILSQEKAIRDNKLIFAYANFLKRPLELGMFIPCDLEGNVLKVIPFHQHGKGSDYEFMQHAEMEEAKERVLFEGFEFEEKEHYNILKYNDFVITFSNPDGGSYNSFDEIWGDKTIEDLTELDLTLTQSAIKLLK